MKEYQTAEARELIIDPLESAVSAYSDYEATSLLRIKKFPPDIAKSYVRKGEELLDSIKRTVPKISLNNLERRLKDEDFHDSFMLWLVRCAYLSEALSWYDRIPYNANGNSILLKIKEASEKHNIPEAIRKFSERKVRAVIDFWADSSWNGSSNSNNSNTQHHD